MHLTPAHIDFILELIDTWEAEVYGKLSVPNLLDRFKKKYGSAPSDRTIRNHARITERLNAKKKLIKEGGVAAPAKPSSLQSAGETITKLKAKVAGLEAENDRIFHKLVQWQKNAMDHGMTKEQLERPLHVLKETQRHIDGDV